jgi:hypothetical protein
MDLFATGSLSRRRAFWQARGEERHAMTLNCHCGQVTVVTADRPDFINACNCSLCRKSGAAWGYFDPAGVTVTGATRQYRRGDKPAPTVDVHFCPACGATTHFALTPAAATQLGNSMTGVNMALAEPADLAGIELRFPDGRGWSGEGPFGYRRAAQTITDGL